MLRLFISFIISGFFACIHAMSSWYGVQVQPMNKDMLESVELTGETGVIVVGVDPYSPANQALQQGDVLLSPNNKPMTFQALIKQKLLPGQHVDLMVWRKSKKIATHFTIPQAQSGQTIIDDNILGNVEIEQTPAGVIVAVVHRYALLQEGDKIIEINNQKIQQVDDVQHALQVDDKSLSVAIERNGTRIVQSFAVDGNGSFFSSQTIISSN